MSKLYQGYIVPAKDENAIGYDAKTGIRTSPSGNEHILVSFKHFLQDENGNSVKKDGMYQYRQDLMNIYPQDRKTFTDAERRMMKPLSGFNFQVNHDVEINRQIDANGKELPANVNLSRGNGSVYTIARNYKASRDEFRKEYGQKLKAGRENAAKEREESAVKQEAWVNSLDKISGMVPVLEEPKHFFSKTFNSVMTEVRIGVGTLPVPKDQELNNGTMKLRFPYSPGDPEIKEGDNLNLTDAGTYVNQKRGTMNLYMANGKGVKVENDPERGKEKQPFQGVVSALYEQNGAYKAYVYSEDEELVDGIGEEMAVRGKQSVLTLNKKQAAPLLKEAGGKTTDLAIPVSGEGKKTYGLSRTHRVREEFDLRGTKGSIQMIDRGGEDQPTRKGPDKSAEKTKTAAMARKNGQR